MCVCVRSFPLFCVVFRDIVLLCWCVGLCFELHCVVFCSMSVTSSVFCSMFFFLVLPCCCGDVSYPSLCIAVCCVVLCCDVLWSCVECHYSVLCSMFLFHLALVLQVCVLFVFSPVWCSVLHWSMFWGASLCSPVLRGALLRCFRPPTQGFSATPAEEIITTATRN